MTTTNRNTGIIDIEVLLEFVAKHAHDTIGERHGRSTTLVEELGQVGKMAAKADAYRMSAKGEIPSSTRAAFAMAELSTDEKIAFAKINYRSAAKKVVWLNAMSFNLIGKRFIMRKIDMSDLVDMVDLLDDLHDAMIDCRQF